MPLFLKEKKNLKILIALVLFQLILISLQVPLGDEENYFEKAIFSIFSPMQHGVVSFFQTIGTLWKRYFFLQNVQSQNQKMKEEIFSLQQENNILKNALKKLKKKKEIEDNLIKIHKDILVAQVIGFDASNYYKSVTVNKGSLDSLKKDMVVLDRIGNLVGRVVGPISLKEARIQLITDNESGVSVFSQESEAMGVLNGNTSGYCLFKYILSTNKEISIGETLITSGFDGIFPSGIKVGKITSVTENTSIFKQIKVKPFFDFRHLGHVAVLLKQPEEMF